MHLRAVTHDDIPAFARAVTLAMSADEVMQFTSPKKDVYPLSFERHVLSRALRRFYSGQFLFLVVTDSTDVDWNGEEVVMGYCCYSTNIESVTKPCPGGWLGNAFERWALDVWSRYAALFRLDWSADPAAERHFRSMCEEDMFAAYFEALSEQHKRTKGDGHWELELLGTVPGFRRRGVGKLSLQWGFDKARVDGVPLVLLSSIIGEKLYSSVGFRVVDKLNMLAISGDETGTLGRLTTERFKDTDFGMGIGNGLEWSAMVWEPETMQPAIEEEAAIRSQH